MACAGSIAQVIPPSLTMVILAVVSQLALLHNSDYGRFTT
nr:hypothetical protein [Puniceibacterium sediminis]